MAAATNLEIRIAVGTIIGPRSNVWRIWSQNNEVYAAHRLRAHMNKLSFHSSGICRRAFTTAYGLPPDMNDRAIKKWKRAPTPEAGACGGSLALRVITPTAFLSAIGEKVPDKPVVWLTPKENEATSFDLFFTKEPENVVIDAFAKATDSQLIKYHRLPHGEGVGISAAHGLWTAENFILPASRHAQKTIVVATVDPHNTGRPIRFSADSNPKDGDALLCHEFGAYEVEPNDPLIGLIPFTGTFSRDKVIATQATVPKAWSLPK